MRGVAETSGSRHPAGAQGTPRGEYSETTGARHPTGAQSTLASRCCLTRAVCRHSPWVLRLHSTQSGGLPRPWIHAGSS
eukprot:1095839-Pyramimonas_sp.AAC.1